MSKSTDTKTEAVEHRTGPLFLEGGGEATDKTPATTKLDAGAAQEQNVKLDALGPMVVNSDGTLSRISNWANMTDQEKERTLRVLNARNKLRLAKQAAETEVDSSASVSALKVDTPPTASKETQPST